MYKNDFVELFNRGSVDVDLSGWSVQYAGASSASWAKTPLAGTLAPGHYFLVQEAAGTGGAQPLPTPDAIGAIPLAAGAGKVALVKNDSTLSGACPNVSALADFVGYGGGVNCSEGAQSAPAPGNVTAVLRRDEGCSDTDDNAADFAAGQPAPRNTSAPPHACVNVTPQTEAGAAPSSNEGAPPHLSADFYFGAFDCSRREEFGRIFITEEFSEPRPRAGSTRSRRAASAYGPRGTRAGPPRPRGASP